MKKFAASAKKKGQTINIRIASNIKQQSEQNVERSKELIHHSQFPNLLL